MSGGRAETQLRVVSHSVVFNPYLEVLVPSEAAPVDAELVRPAVLEPLQPPAHTYNLAALSTVSSAGWVQKLEWQDSGRRFRHEEGGRKAA